MVVVVGGLGRIIGVVSLVVDGVMMVVGIVFVVVAVVGTGTSQVSVRLCVCLFALWCPWWCLRRGAQRSWVVWSFFG